MSATKIEATVRRFVDDPPAARTAPTVTAVSANGHARLSAGPFNWESDLSNALGGGNQAPSPTTYLLGALAGCAVTFINDTLAPQFGVEVGKLRATARCTNDLAALLGIDGSSPELQNVEIDIDIDSPSPNDRVEAMQQAWLDRCPILLAVQNPRPVKVTFSRSKHEPAMTRRDSAASRPPVR